MIFDDCLLYNKSAACMIVAQTVMVRCKAADICDQTCPKWFDANTTTDILRADERYWDKDYHERKNLHDVCDFIMVPKPKSCKK